MQTNRRGFLGAMAAVLAMPSLAEVKLEPSIIPTGFPIKELGRGQLTSIFHIDEAAFYPSTGKSGQILVYGENGPEWQDPPKAGDLHYDFKNHLMQVRTEDGQWVPLKSRQEPVDTSMYQQTYAIPMRPISGS